VNCRWRVSGGKYTQIETFKLNYGVPTSNLESNPVQIVLETETGLSLPLKQMCLRHLPRSMDGRREDVVASDKRWRLCDEKQQRESWDLDVVVLRYLIR